MTVMEDGAGRVAPGLGRSHGAGKDSCGRYGRGLPVSDRLTVTVIVEHPLCP